MGETQPFVPESPVPEGGGATLSPGEPQDQCGRQKKAFNKAELRGRERPDTQWPFLPSAEAPSSLPGLTTFPAGLRAEREGPEPGAAEIRGSRDVSWAWVGAPGRAVTLQGRDCPWSQAGPAGCGGAGRSLGPKAAEPGGARLAPEHRGPRGRPCCLTQFTASGQGPVSMEAGGGASFIPRLPREQTGCVVP